MINRHQLAVLLILFTSCGWVISCDMFRSSSERAFVFGQDSFLTFTIHHKALEWKDEVAVDGQGNIQMQRLEGDEIPPAERKVHKDEWLHFKNVFKNIHDFEGECAGYDRESGVILYTFRLDGENGERTVHCDGSSLSRNDENEQLRPIVSQLREFRMSLIGERRVESRLNFELKPDKTTYTLDDPVVLQYTLTNKTGNPVVMGFPSGCQTGFHIYKDGDIVFSSNAFVCTGALTQWEIPPLATETRKFEWDHGAFDGSRFHDRKVKSGTYTVIQFIRNGNSPFRSSEITITEEGENKLQARIDYNRFEDPNIFTYELNNRISKSFSFDFTIDRKVGFEVSEYDVSSRKAGEIVYTDTSGTPAKGDLTVSPFEEYSWIESWDLTDNEGNPVPQSFYWVEMWLLDQDPEYRTGRMLFIDP